MADATKIVELKGKTSHLKKELKGAEKSLNEFTLQLTSAQKVWQSAGSSMMLIGGALIAGVVIPLGMMSKASLDSAAEFEQGMASVAAVSGAMGDEFDKLSEQAKHLGATTRFTAVEAAEGMVMLGRAGWEATQILDAMPGLLNLSAAGMIDLGRAADIVSDVMMAFGENADQATRYADIFASAAANANTTVEGLGNAMAYAAPAASNMGVSIEQTAASLAIFADAGIKATRAGTTMDAMLRELRNKVGEDGKVDFEHFSVSVYDSAGAMRDFYDIMEEIYAGMDGLTQQQKDHASGLIFSTRALRGFNVMQTAGIERLREMESTLKSSAGASEDMADIMMNTLQGAVIELTSAFDGLKISFGENLLPLTTAIVRGFTTLLRAFTAIPAPIKVMMTVFSALVAVMIIAVTIFGTLIVVMTKLIGAVPRLAFRLKAARVSMEELTLASYRNTKATAAQRLAIEAQVGSFKMLRREIRNLIALYVFKLKVAFFTLVQTIHNRVIPALKYLAANFRAVALSALSNVIFKIQVAFFSLVKVIHNYVIPAFVKLFTVITAHPIIAVVTAILAAFIGLSHYLSNKLTQDFTDFSDTVSEETSQVLSSFLKMSDNVEQKLRIMSNNSGLITEEMMEEVGNNFHAMANQVIAEMERTKNEGIDALNELYLYSKTLTPTEFQLIQAGMLDMAEQKIRELMEVQREYAALEAEIAAQGGKATQEQLERMRELSKEVREAAIDALAENLGEAQRIRIQMQRDEKARNAKHAGDMIKDANKEYQDRLDIIEAFYIKQMRVAQYFEDQGMGDFAERLRAETENAYYQMRYEAVRGQADLMEDLRDFAGLYATMINQVTGEVKSGWQIAWQFLATPGWVGMIYNLVNPLAKLKKEAREMGKEMGLSGEALDAFVKDIVSLEERLLDIEDAFSLTKEAVEQIRGSFDLEEDEFLAVLEEIIQKLQLTEEEAEDFIDKLSNLKIDVNSGMASSLDELNKQIMDSFALAAKTAEEQLEELKHYHDEAREHLKRTLADQTIALEQEHDKRLQKLREHHNEARRIFDDRMDKEIRRLDERQMKELAQYDNRIAAILREQKAEDRQSQLTDRQKRLAEQRQKLHEATLSGSTEAELQERQALQELVAQFNREDRDNARQTEIEKIRQQRDAHAERLQEEKKEALERLESQKETLDKKLKVEEDALRESLDSEKKAFLEKAEVQKEHLDDSLKREEEYYKDSLSAQEAHQQKSLDSYKDHINDLKEAEGLMDELEGAGAGLSRKVAEMAKASTPPAVSTPALYGALSGVHTTSTPSVLNEFNIENLIVRDDQDIEKIARELYRMQDQNGRGLG